MQVSKIVAVVAAVAAFTTFSVLGNDLPAVIKAISQPGARLAIEGRATKEIPSINWNRLENNPLRRELRISGDELAALKANVKAINADPRRREVETVLSLYREVQGEIPGRVFRLLERPQDLDPDMQKIMQQVINQLLSEKISANLDPSTTFEYLSGN
jgi:hypothetical protein